LVHAKVLIADDDPNVCEIIRIYLQENHFNVIEASDGEQALSLFETEKPDIILLDVMMPGLDGFDVCRQIRKKTEVPIIMLSAKAEELDRILGLEMGADDYVTKPFSPREVLARIKAVFRRTSHQGQEEKEETFKFRDLLIHVKKREVKLNETVLFFRPKEFDLLVYLIRHKHIVVTREQLLEHVWGYDFIGDIRTVDVHIKRIRSEFEPFNFQCIKTVWGVGYQFYIE